MWIILRTVTRDLFLVMVMLRVSSALAVEHQGPVRAWGELSSTYRVRESGASDSKNSSWLNTATISASSYIWRPWFALVGGSLNLSIEDSDSEDQPTTTNEFATGNLNFGLFPTSRFPFNAYFIESRNQLDNDAFGRDVTTTEYGVSQLYRSLDGSHNYRAEYENNLQDDDGDENKFVSESLLLSAGNRLGRHDINTEIKLDAVDNSNTNDQADSHSITLEHDYGEATNFSIDNLVSTSTADIDLFDSRNEVDTSQLSSFLSWNPRNRKDLRLTGNLRLSEVRLSRQLANAAPNQVVESETEIANLNQGLIYQVSDNLQLSESINANTVENAGEEVFTASETLSARYSSDRINIAVGDYGWTAITTYNNLHGDVVSKQSLDNQFSHSLLNNYSLEGGYQMRTNLTQSLDYEYQSEQADEKSIDHSYSVTWSNAAINNQSLIRFFISDSHSLNRDDDYRQLLNLQYTGTNRMSRYAQLSGNVTLQHSRLKFDGQLSEQTVSNGQLEFRRERAFQVPGMSFLSLLELSKTDSEAEQLINDPDTDTLVSWENSLFYRIGRLEVELEIDFIKVDDEFDRLFKLKLTRSFGDL